MHTRDDFREIRDFFRKTGQTVKYQKGELIIRAGETPKGIYLVNSGIVKAYMLSRQDDQHIHHFFGTGDIFPITFIFQDYIRDTYYESVEPVEVVIISREKFWEFLSESSSRLGEILEEVVYRFARYSNRIENLLYSNSQERCAYRLLSLASRFGLPGHEGITINACLTHEDMARSLNMTRETFSRVLSRFQEKGYISYDLQRRIIIKDVPAIIKVIGSDSLNPAWSQLSENLIESAG